MINATGVGSLKRCKHFQNSPEKGPSKRDPRITAAAHQELVTSTFLIRSTQARQIRQSLGVAGAPQAI